MKPCPYCAEDIQEVAVKCKHCGEFLDAGTTHVSPARQKLFLSSTDKMLTGVCGGLAKYANVDPSIVRVLVVLTVLMTGVVPGIVAYFVLLFVVPEEKLVE